MKMQPPLTFLAAAALGILCSATPVAVSAQATATVRASATVVHPDAAWTGAELAHAVARATMAESTGMPARDPMSGIGIQGVRDLVQRPVRGPRAVRAERNGTVVWVDPSGPDRDGALVMVAHLGS